MNPPLGPSNIPSSTHGDPYDSWDSEDEDDDVASQQPPAPDPATEGPPIDADKDEMPDDHPKLNPHNKV